MKGNITNNKKPLLVFISPNAVTRSSIQDFLKEKWAGDYKVFSNIKNKSMIDLNIHVLFLDLSGRFLMDIEELNSELSHLNTEVHFFFDKDLVDYCNGIRLMPSANLIGYCKPKEQQFDFIRAKLNEYLPSLEKKFSLKLTEGVFDLKRVPDLIAIGASTGGPEALVKIIKKLNHNLPPILIVLHMAPNFIEGFCRRLQSLTSLRVIEFQEYHAISQNLILVASGESHMIVQAKGSKLYAVQGGSEKVNGHCPSVDILFNSISELKEYYPVGALLTGMGKDGARGLLNIKNSGGLTIAQDEMSSTIYGMPKEAREIDAAQIVTNIEELSQLFASFSK